MEVIDNDDGGGVGCMDFLGRGFCFLFRGIAVLGMRQCERRSGHYWD